MPTISAIFSIYRSIYLRCDWSEVTNYLRAKNRLLLLQLQIVHADYSTVQILQLQMVRTLAVLVGDWKDLVKDLVRYSTLPFPPSIITLYPVCLLGSTTKYVYVKYPCVTPRWPPNIVSLDICICAVSEAAVNDTFVFSLNIFFIFSTTFA